MKKLIWICSKRALIDLFWTAWTLTLIYLVITSALSWGWTFALLAVLCFALIVNVQILWHNGRVMYFGIRAAWAGYKMFKTMEEFFGKGNVVYGAVPHGNHEEGGISDAVLHGVKPGDNIEDFIEEYEEDGVTKTRWKKC